MSRIIEGIRLWDRRLRLVYSVAWPSHGRMSRNRIQPVIASDEVFGSDNISSLRIFCGGMGGNDIKIMQLRTA